MILYIYYVASIFPLQHDMVAGLYLEWCQENYLHLDWLADNVGIGIFLIVHATWMTPRNQLRISQQQVADLFFVKGCIPQGWRFVAIRFTQSSLKFLRWIWREHLNLEFHLLNLDGSIIITFPQRPHAYMTCMHDALIISAMCSSVFASPSFKRRSIWAIAWSSSFCGIPTSHLRGFRSWSSNVQWGNGHNQGILKH